MANDNGAVNAGQSADKAPVTPSSSAKKRKGKAEAHEGEESSPSKKQKAHGIVKTEGGNENNGED